MAAGTAAANPNVTNPIQKLPRYGSGLKTDRFHSFPDLVDNFAGSASEFLIPKLGAGGAVVGNSRLYQVEGSLNGVSGVFEWIVDNGLVTHRVFNPGGTVSGVPNLWP